MKPAKKQFKPQNLRAILATLLVIILLAGGAGFYWGLDVVRAYAIKVNHTLADAEASGNQVKELQTLKGQLAQSNTLIDKANQLFATPASYQARALSDLKKYADISGLSITNTSFSDPAGSGVYSITISLRQPVPYKNLITFLNNLEGNLPKLQVSSIALGRASTGGAVSVKTGDIKIDIAVR
jgi:type II secretory pathway component PulM